MSKICENLRYYKGIAGDSTKADFRQKPIEDRFACGSPRRDRVPGSTSAEYWDNALGIDPGADQGVSYSAPGSNVDVNNYVDIHTFIDYAIVI